METKKAKLVVNKNHGYVANTQHFNGLLKPPPKGHKNAVDCPQCDNWTWANSMCLHCGFDVPRYFKNLKNAKEKQKLEAQLKVMKIKMLKLAMIFFCFLLLFIGLQHYLLLTSWWFVIVFIVGAIITKEVIEIHGSKMDELKKQIDKLAET